MGQYYWGAGAVVLTSAPFNSWPVGTTLAYMDGCGVGQCGYTSATPNGCQSECGTGNFTIICTQYTMTPPPPPALPPPPPPPPLAAPTFLSPQGLAYRVWSQDGSGTNEGVLAACFLPGNNCEVLPPAQFLGRAGAPLCSGFTSDLSSITAATPGCPLSGGYAIVLDGYFSVPTSGSHTFSVAADDVAALFLGPAATGTVSLAGLRAWGASLQPSQALVQVPIKQKCLSCAQNPHPRASEPYAGPVVPISSPVRAGHATGWTGVPHRRFVRTGQ